MQADTVEILAPVASRIVLVDGDADRRAELGDHLVGAGFQVRTLPDSSSLLRLLSEWRPNLLLLHETLPGGSGREVALKLRAQGAYFDIPIVGLIPEVSVPLALHWLHVGAVDLWAGGTQFDPAERAKGLLDELVDTRVHTGSTKARLVAWARRRNLSGTVLFYPDTPFEGRARFDGGELASVRFGGATGDEAFEQLLALDDAPAKWVPGDEVTGQHRVPGGAYRPRVLVVEDDDALRGLLQKQLAHLGDVEAAADGIEGLMLGTSARFDVVVADLNLPGLDGWGLLRQLRQNLTAREAAVLVLSAHDELRETLKAARAGARAYLKKSGRAKPLLDTLELLLAPRRHAWDSLARNERTELDLRLLGPLWTLRALAELDLVGTLTLEEPLGSFEVKVSHGQLVSARVRTGSTRVDGVMAIEALLSSTAAGAFVPGDVGPVPKDAPWVFEAAERAGKALEAWHSARMRDAVSNPGRLHLHPELSLLFARTASEKELKVLAALRHQAGSIAALSDEVGLPYEDVELALSEFLRRGVLLTEAPVDASSASGVFSPNPGPTSAEP